MDRIQLEDSVMDVIVKLSEGNPGAVRVCSEVLAQGGVIDPDDAFGGMGALLGLDTGRIYGPKIWMLFKDVCQSSVSLTIASLRSVQLGFTPIRVLHHAIEHRGEGFDIAEAYRKVKERLPSFADVQVQEGIEVNP